MYTQAKEQLLFLAVSLCFKLTVLKSRHQPIYATPLTICRLERTGAAEVGLQPLQLSPLEASVLPWELQPGQVQANELERKAKLLASWCLLEYNWEGGGESQLCVFLSNLFHCCIPSSSKQQSFHVSKHPQRNILFLLFNASSYYSATIKNILPAKSPHQEVQLLVMYPGVCLMSSLGIWMMGQSLQMLLNWAEW